MIPDKEIIVKVLKNMYNNSNWFKIFKHKFGDARFQLLSKSLKLSSQLVN